MRQVIVGDRPVGDGYPCFVVAEIGINHNGDVSLAQSLIASAESAGCDAVKFQKRTVEVVYSPEELAKKRKVPPSNGIMLNAVRRGVLSEEAARRLEESNFEDTTNGDLKFALELTEAEFREIDTLCARLRIPWFASPWDESSVEFLERMGVPFYKIASPSLTDSGLLTAVRETGKAVILSTGMSSIGDVRRAVSLLDPGKLLIMHCVSTYPTQDEDLNLKVIGTLREEFPDIPIGYSGHEKDIIPSVVAVGLGACMLERHICKDRRLWGSDQASSIEPHEFAELVRQVRRLEVFMGDSEKRLLEREVEVQKKLRRKYFGE